MHLIGSSLIGSDWIFSSTLYAVPHKRRVCPFIWRARWTQDNRNEPTSAVALPLPLATCPLLPPLALALAPLSLVPCPCSSCNLAPCNLTLALCPVSLPLPLSLPTCPLTLPHLPYIVQLIPVLLRYGAALNARDKNKQVFVSTNYLFL